MKPLSPIERMIDAATGHNPAEAKTRERKSVTAIDVQAQALLDVADAVKAWYLAGKAGNVTGRDVTAMKEAVAAWIRHGG